MKAVTISRYGGNEVVDVADVPVPTPGRDDVLIKVHAASINPVDWKIRNGMLKILTGPAFPKILGNECAGEVVGTGAGVQQFKTGDFVIGFPGIKKLAAFAEYVCVDQGSTFAKPENCGFNEASTLPIAGLTALQALRDIGKIAVGGHVLINGASGGVGTFAVQIAKILGARVTAVCSAGNAALVQDLGADRVLDYAHEDFTKGGESFDVVFDAVAKRSFAECKRVMTAGGIFISTLPTPSVLLNQYLTGFFTRRTARAIIVKPNAADMEWMKNHIEAGRLRVVVDKVFSLGQIKEALTYSESGKAKGKVVLRIGGK